MKNIFISIFLCSLLYTSSTFALTITFNNTAPPGTAVLSINRLYIESGFVFTGLAGTDLFSIDPAYAPTNGSADGTDFQSFEGGAKSWDIGAGPPNTFSLNSFQAAVIYRGPATTLSVTGNLNGGGTVNTVFNLPAFNSTATWSTFNLPAGWSDLTYVNFDFNGGDFVGIDNVIINDPVITAAPTAKAIPTMSVWGLGILAGLLGLIGFYMRRKV